jgi:hypothetical protein
MKTLRIEYQELIRMKEMIETDEFQKYIMKPIYEELDKLKNAYDCESLRELHTVKGKKQGIKTIIEILKNIDAELKNKQYEIENPLA